MTSRLTPLERATLDAIGGMYPDDREALEHQFATARVISRENSGAGFFTYLDIDRSAPPIVHARSPLGGLLLASVEGLPAGMLLMLFTSNGFADMIEGAAMGENTEGMDLFSLRFMIEGQ